MLETLRIKNYALIDEIEIDFQPGFNVLTGETGAGKSILVGALNLVLGARASGDVLRSGADRAKIDAVFRISAPSPRLLALLEENEIALEDGALLLSRSISAEGRSRGYAGGSLAPISLLAAIGNELVDLHGQHEHQSLLRAGRQMDALDAFGGLEEKAAKVGEAVRKLRAIEAELEALESDDRDRARRIEFLRYELKEIDDAGLAPGEEAELRARLNLLNNAETICATANKVYALLYEQEPASAIDLLDEALKDLEALADVDAGFKALAGQLAGLRTGVDAVAAEARGFTEQVELDPQELEALNQRRALLGGLKRKYGGSVEEILAYRGKAAKELDGYENRDARLEELTAVRAAQRAQADSLAQKLSTERKKAAKALEKRVSTALQDLGMKGARFTTAVEAIALAARGIDRVVFLLAANPGEPPKPMKKVASGGEVSRVMLALKSVFADADAIPTLIFDEIDSGVGGAVARNVAGKLAALAASHQVICITHLPQIAAVAEAHFSVTKRSDNGRTFTGVEAMGATARVEELARLLDGSVSEASLEHARTLLQETG